MPKRTETRSRVLELLQEGLSFAEIGRRLDIALPTVSYHAKNLGFGQGEVRRYDWAQVQELYDEGKSMRECREHFGFSNGAWSQAVKRGAIIPRPRARMSVTELLDGPRNRSHLKQRLLDEGLLEPRCGECGIERWKGRPLSLALHHLNGRRNDNRLENFLLLCPNCHSQTDTYAGRNGSSYR